MRVAVALHGRDLSRVVETYNLLSEGYYTHATPTLMNAGRQRQALSSCFILPSDCTTPTATYDGLRDLANILHFDGGAGLGLHAVPAKRYAHPNCYLLQTPRDNNNRYLTGPTLPRLVLYPTCALWMQLSSLRPRTKPLAHRPSPRRFPCGMPISWSSLN